jgi:hypothetical protein
MEVYDEMVHHMETSWDIICESEREKDTATRSRVPQ